MIYGVGVDIVNINRIQDCFNKFGSRFGRKILSEKEFYEFSNTNNPVYFLAKRFAAKEAISKAIGTGMGAKIGFKSITISHDKKGKPHVDFSDAAQLYISTLAINFVHISMSDEVDNAIAFAIAEI